MTASQPLSPLTRPHGKHAVVVLATAEGDLRGRHLCRGHPPHLGRERPPLGALLAAGALGLPAGFVVPVLGTLAASGLVLYFLGALPCPRAGP
ncbi:hypothetical protein [Streptomyces avermitilis]|uniref:hypothetical protein n=1 Tax=Streptomyces avermitilis TaxID=33903 RepID=UPI0037F34BF7